MNIQSKKMAILFFALGIIFLSACSDKYYEMYKSPCACLSKKDLKRIYKEIQAEDLKKDVSKKEVIQNKDKDKTPNSKSSFYRWPKIGLSIKSPKYGNFRFYKILSKRIKKA